MSGAYRDKDEGGTMKKSLILSALLLISILAARFLFVGSAIAQNRLYVRVEFDAVGLISGGPLYSYDHILLLPEGTAFRFENISDGPDQTLPSNFNLFTASSEELSNTDGTSGTYQEKGGTVQTSFDVAFASRGETFDLDEDSSGYMFISPLEPSYITGEYSNFSATVLGDANLTPTVAAGKGGSYMFYPDGNFGLSENSGATVDSGDVIGGSSSESSAAGQYLFEGYNLFLTYGDGSQVILPAYLWPSDAKFEDQILMIGSKEFLDNDESSIPFERIRVR